MRKKLFTFLLALAASIGMMWAETVVINKSEFTPSGVTKGGVTLALSSGSMTSSEPVAMDGSFEFSTSLGKFTGITIETDANIMEIYEGAFTSAGWPTGDNLGKSAAWTGESETVLISCMVAGMDNITITCTIEPAPATGLQVVEVTSDIYNGWNSNGNTFSVNALPGFQAVTFDEAKAWTEVPTSGTAVLVYRTNGDYARVIHFFDGTISGDYDLETDFNQMYENITLFGNRIFYTTGGGSTPAVDPAVQNVIDLINAIPNPVVYNQECFNALNAAHNAYVALTEEQRDQVTNYDDYLAAEETYWNLKAANDVITLINAIGDVEYTPECKAKIDAARSAYNNLNLEKKGYVTNYNTLLAAEAAYAALIPVSSTVVWDEAVLATINVENGTENETFTKDDITLTALNGHAYYPDEDDHFLLDGMNDEPFSFSSTSADIVRIEITVSEMMDDTELIDGWQKTATGYRWIGEASSVDFGITLPKVTQIAFYLGNGSTPAPTPNPSGECGAQGDNLLWELNTSTGVLTITGSGAMNDWPDDTNLPWYDNRLDITSVVLPSGITSLGTKAFRGCQNLASINMTENYPAGLTAINQEAFCHTKLTSVIIPESVVTIGQDAFYRSENITDVYCYADPNNLTWTDFWCDDFNKTPAKSTQCHVKDCYLAVYNSKWNTSSQSTDVNVTFVGDLPGDCGAPTPTPSGDKLPGVFSVSADKAVCFSKGNLQYNSGTQAWQFAENQWDYIGNAAGNKAITVDGIPDNSGIVDLFGWVGASSSWITGSTQQYGISTSTTNNDYGNVYGEALKQDWGNTMGSDWRTLSKDEWNYLLTERANAANLRTLATVNDKTGLILMPDGWTASGVSLTVTKENYTDNTIGSSDWATLAGQGCVFLPAAGSRNGNWVMSAGTKGHYWSSTSRPDGASLNSFKLVFMADDVDPTDYTNRYTGLSVRLVSETAPTPTPTPTPTDEQVPTNEDPENPGTYYYSTFFHSTQNYKLTNDGTQAFIATLGGNDLVLTKIAEGAQVIPANTAVIFRKSGSADPVVLTPTEENGVSVNPNDNSLKGVDAETAITSIDGLTTTNCYVLSGTNEYGVGFYRINSDNLKAHKAYVKYAGLQTNAPRRMRFVFNQEQTATGMENVQNEETKAQKVMIDGVMYIIRGEHMYDAQGQIVK